MKKQKPNFKEVECATCGKIILKTGVYFRHPTKGIICPDCPDFHFGKIKKP